MSSVLPSPQSARLGAGPALPWLIVLAGFAAMYGPVYVWAAMGIWQTDEHGHGALVLAVLAWLFWRIHRPLIELPAAPAPAAVPAPAPAAIDANAVPTPATQPEPQPEKP